MITLFSVDDHEVIHLGLQQLASAEPDLEFLGATTDPARALDLVAGLRPDVVLLDLFIGEEQGWDTCRALTTAVPDTKVIFYSGYGNAELVDRAIRSGASGYLLKGTSLAGLPEMLRTAQRTGQALDADLLKEWMDFRRRLDERPTLTSQELDLVRLIAEGLDNHQIAEAHHLSFHTVKFHIGKMLKKTGETNRAGLVRWATERHLLDQ
ncbi:response regulator [Propionibacteriaceae bacterium Y1923]|uniref:response regulator n=1 Tax=Aestuariimicrobium sp. Y1814 TaxID=3418742 RepID=UPI003C29B339